MDFCGQLLSRIRILLAYESALSPPHEPCGTANFGVRQSSAALAFVWTTESVHIARDLVDSCQSGRGLPHCSKSWCPIRAPRFMASMREVLLRRNLTQPSPGEREEPSSLCPFVDKSAAADLGASLSPRERVGVGGMARPKVLRAQTRSEQLTLTIIFLMRSRKFR